jgi:hypothetical protein
MSLNLKQLVVDDMTALGPAASARKYMIHVNTAAAWIRGSTEPSAAAVQIAYDEHAARVLKQSEYHTWEGKKVAILIPVYRSMEIGFVHTLIANYAKYGAEKLAVFIEESTIIEEARNTLIARFMESGCDVCIFLDSDMLLSAGSAALMNGHYNLNIPEAFASKLLFSELLRHEVDCVGALYVGRNPKGVAQFAEAFENPKINHEAHHFINAGLRETKWVATGAMAIRRTCFLKMQELAPTIFQDIIPRIPGANWGYFKRMTHGVGEDVSFCWRLRECGIKVHVDTSLVCGHIGFANYSPYNTRTEP